jgi:PAS domain S-box-containing protein
VVEDEAIVALDIEARLRMLGYGVTGVARSGAEALRLIADRTPDLVLMDIHIQGPMDGIDTAREVKTRFHRPVVFLTAYSEDGTLQRAKLAEPYGYILKPFEERELKSVIEMALYKHEAEQEILRLNRLYATLSQVNQAVVRIRSRQELFEDFCRIAVDFGGFQRALVRWHDPAADSLNIVASAGAALPVLDELSELGRAPNPPQTICEQAFRDNCTRVVSDLSREPGLEHQAAGLQPAGLCAAAVLPIRLSGRAAGVFAVFGTQPHSFPDEEIRLLEEVAADISFALDHLSAEERRREAEEALATSERKFRSIFECMANGSCYNRIVRDPEGHPVDYRILDVNPALEPILGITREQARGNLASEVHGDAPFLREFARVAETGEPVTFETWFPAARKHLRITASCPERGHFTTLVADITAEKQQAEQLARLRADLETAQQVAHLGSWVAEAPDDGNLTWSAETYRIFGLTRDAFDDRVETFLKYVHPDDRDRLLQAAKAAWQGGASYDLEHRVIRPDGSVRWVHEMAQVERDDRGAPVRMVGVVKDVTEQRRIAREARDREAQSRHQERLAALGTLAGGVAHEINNPVNGIMNYAEIIGDGLPEDSPLKTYTAEILNETRRVTDIVKHLLSFARQDTAEFRSTSLDEVVDGTLCLIRTLFKRDRIVMKVSIEPGLPRVTSQGSRLQQVLMNLMTNARDALNDKFPGHDPDKKLHVSARSLERNGRTWVRLTVEDNGCGIPPEVQERMFEPFFTTKGPEEGTGLGLAISHGIVKEHHGEIHCETQLGGFTRFHVDLPADPVPDGTTLLK